MSESMILNLVLIALSATGVTGLAKRATKNIKRIDMAPVVKQGITVVAAIVLAAMTGQDAGSLVPDAMGGSLTDAGLVGVLVTAIYAVVGKKPKKKKA